MRGKDFPFNIISLFPEDTVTNPEDNPLVKAMLDDIRVSTEPTAMEVSEGLVVLTWDVGDETIIMTIDPNHGSGAVTSHDDDGNKLLEAILHLAESNRFVGYYIDDRT